MSHLARLLTTAALALGLASAAQAQESRTVCVYDPAGKAGVFYAHMTRFSEASLGWGQEVALKAYTDEETAVRDYEAGQCDGVVVTGVRLQRFNRFPTTLEAMGALQSYDELSQMVTTLASSGGAAAKLRSGDHETVGFLSAGTVYLFLRDREVDTVPELGGKRVATMDYDAAAPQMVSRMGAVMVPADLGSIGPKFNNGAVDIAYMSAQGYEPFELHRGIGTAGGVLRYPLAQATLQVMLRAPSFEDSFLAQARGWLAVNFDDTVAASKTADQSIPASAWVDLDAATRARWDDLFLEVRVDLRDNGVYDGDMLRVMRQLRCANDSARAECAQPRE